MVIKELESFEDQNLLVEISFDDGETSKPISLVGKIRKMSLLHWYLSDIFKKEIEGFSYEDELAQLIR